MARYIQLITIQCPECDSANVVQNGKRNGYQRYQCNDCWKHFNTEGNALGMKNEAEVIGSAIDMYYSGVSYKQIAENLEKVHNLPNEPSKRTIYQWVKNYTDAALLGMEGKRAKSSGHWVADEMQLKVGGERLWNWNVMDFETRYIYASHLSRNRDTRAARVLFKKALRNADKPPETITTDGLGSYGAAIEEIFGDSTKHFVSQGIYELVNNNHSERLQGSFRQRTKTMRGLQTRASGQRYLDGWVLDYNLFKDHEALGGKTPAQVALPDVPYREWADVTRSGTRKRPSNPQLALVKPEVRATRRARRQTHRKKLPSLASVAQKIGAEKAQGSPPPTRGGNTTRGGSGRSAGRSAEYRAGYLAGMKAARQKHSGRGGHDFKMTGPRSRKKR